MGEVKKNGQLLGCRDMTNSIEVQKMGEVKKHYKIKGKSKKRTIIGGSVIYNIRGKWKI